MPELGNDLGFQPLPEHKLGAYVTVTTQVARRAAELDHSLTFDDLPADTRTQVAQESQKHSDALRRLVEISEFDYDPETGTIVGKLAQYRAPENFGTKLEEDPDAFLWLNSGKQIQIDRVPNPDKSPDAPRFGYTVKINNEPVPSSISGILVKRFVPTVVLREKRAAEILKRAAANSQ